GRNTARGGADLADDSPFGRATSATDGDGVRASFRPPVAFTTGADAVAQAAGSPVSRLPCRRSRRLSEPGFHLRRSREENLSPAVYLGPSLSPQWTGHKLDEAVAHHVLVSTNRIAVRVWRGQPVDLVGGGAAGTVAGPARRPRRSARWPSQTPQEGRT